MSSIIAVSSRIIVATHPSMDEALVEATRTNVPVSEKVISLLNSMASNPLPFPLDSSNLKIVKLMDSLSNGAVVGVIKSTSAVIEDASEAVGCYGSQPSLVFFLLPITQSIVPLKNLMKGSKSRCKSMKKEIKYL